MHTKYISFHTTHIHLFPNIHNYRIALHLYLAFLKVNSLEIYFMFLYFFGTQHAGNSFRLSDMYLLALIKSHKQLTAVNEG